MTDSDKEKCLEAQIDELEALKAIYGDQIHVDTDAKTHSITIRENEKTACLHVTLPELYPLKEPPVYTLSAPHLSKDEKLRICNILETTYLSNIGNSVIYQWVEAIKEVLIDMSPLVEDEIVPDLPDAEEEIMENTPNIVHGDVITDRKSTFQPHFAKVTSVNEVKLVLKKLKENKKIANATHNIYAYRISQPGSKYFLQDCDDDGEAHAGDRMLHLLQILEVADVLVVVSRWYGGIHLGADRFRHINNAVRAILEKVGMIKK